MMLIGALNPLRGVLLFIVQLLGGMTAAAIVQQLFQGGLNVQTTLGGNTTIAQGVLIEMILTAELVFTIFMLAAAKHEGNFIAPVGIGLALFISELVGELDHRNSIFSPLSSHTPCESHDCVGPQGCLS